MAAKRVLQRILLTLVGVVGLLVTPHLSSAHPLGNFSISHYAGIRIEPHTLVLRYLIDMAEIPTFQELQEAKIVPRAEHPSLPGYLSQRLEALQAGLVLELDGERLPLNSEASEVIFPPGAGGLPTLKLGILFRAQLPSASVATVNELRYRDMNFSGRAGWKEIIATVGQSSTLVRSTVPERDRSHELADYPTDLLHSPPQDLEARVVFIRQTLASEMRSVGSPLAGPPSTRQDQSASTQAGEDPGEGKNIIPGEDRPLIEPVRLAANRQLTPRSSFTELVTSQQLGFSIILMAMAVSVSLGAFHALEPGHGKTVVAAYLVGSRGTARHAMILGLIVTVTHTAGVYILGVATLLASRYVVPEHLYPWLGVTSGLMIAALGFSLFLRRYAGSTHGRGHHHHIRAQVQAHGHTHGHREKHVHTHGYHGHDHHVPSTVSVRELMALGVTGGIVPCPAALVVLLSALSMHRIGFGLLLIVAFSIGLAAVLIAIGILMVYAQRLLARFQSDGPLISRWLPLTSAAVMTALGIAIAIQALITSGIVQIQL